MKELTAEPNPSETKEAAKKPGAKRGRKPSKTRRRKVPAGRGAMRLRDSVNQLVDEQSYAIAKALVKNAVKGNVGVARLVVGMTGADKPPAPAKKKRSGPSWAELLASEPEWDPSMEEDEKEPEASEVVPCEPDGPDEPKSSCEASVVG